MEQHHQPSKYEVRELLAELIEDRKPLPDPEAIKRQLWPIDSREVKAVTS